MTAEALDGNGSSGMRIGSGSSLILIREYRGHHSFVRGW